MLAYAAGNIPSFGATGRRHLLAFDIVTGAAERWAPNPDGPVAVMDRNPFHLYIGGEFMNAWNLPRTRLAAFAKSSLIANAAGQARWTRSGWSNGQPQKRIAASP